MSRAGKLLEQNKVADTALERIQPRQFNHTIYNLAKLHWRRNNYALKPVPQSGHQPSTSGAEG